MTEYPFFVYRSPGPHRAHLGASYEYKAVNDADELVAALEKGWFRTADEAVATAGQDAYTHGLNKRQLAKVLKDKPWVRALPPVPAPVPAPAVVAAPAVVPDDNAAPTRAEIEEQATLLGIKFDGRTTDKRLLERIAEAMKGA